MQFVGIHEKLLKHFIISDVGCRGYTIIIWWQNWWTRQNKMPPKSLRMIPKIIHEPDWDLSH